MLILLTYVILLLTGHACVPPARKKILSVSESARLRFYAAIYGLTQYTGHEIIWITGRKEKVYEALRKKRPQLEAAPNLLVVPKTIVELIRQCAEPFILLHLLLMSNEGHPSHANMLILDRERKEVRRIEPHGLRSPSFYMPEKLDQALAAEFKKTFEYRYISPEQEFDERGPCYRSYAFGHVNMQTLESQENDVKIPGGPLGWCAAWSLWYTHLRLQYPKPSTKNLADGALQMLMIAKGGGLIHSFREYIASYINILIEGGLLLLKTVSGEDKFALGYGAFADPNQLLLRRDILTYSPSIIRYITKEKAEKPPLAELPAESNSPERPARRSPRAKRGSKKPRARQTASRLRRKKPTRDE